MTGTFPVSTAGSISITGREVAAKEATTRRAEVCIALLIASRPGFCSHREEDEINVLKFDEDDRRLVDFDSRRATQAETQLTNKSYLQIIEDITIKRRSVGIMETIVVKLLEKSNQRATKGEKNTVSETLESAVRKTVAEGAVNEII